MTPQHRTPRWREAHCRLAHVWEKSLCVARALGKEIVQSHYEAEAAKALEPAAVAQCWPVGSGRKRG